MGNLTKNLSRSEFACKCNYPECTRTPVDFALPGVIQDCADHFAHAEHSRSLMFVRIAVHVNSGFRCDKHNDDVTDGKGSGIHTLAMGADIWMEYVYGDGTRKRVPDEQIADYFEIRYPGQYGIGRYPRPDYPKNGQDTDMPRTHIDVRNDSAARWEG